MREKFSRHSLIAVPFLLGLFFFAGLMNVKAITIYGVNTSNQLVRFDSGTPSNVTTVGTITGLQAGESILEIDFRPADGTLFGLGSGSRIYTINITTGAATLVASLTTALNGTNFGFDFNPMVDRIRIVSDADQNLRVNPADGVTIVDGTLVFAAGDVNSGINPNVAGTFYTNNVAGTTSTGLFNIDTNLDILVQQTPANNGTLTTIGSLGVDATRVGGADFTSVTNTTYAILVVNGVQSLYIIDPSGAALLIGAVNNVGVIRGIAIQTVVGQTPTPTATATATPTVTATATATATATPTGTPSATPTATATATATATVTPSPTATPTITPSPTPITVTGVTIFGVNSSNQLLRFNSAMATNVTTVGTITGLQAGESILEIDFRPATGVLYGLGSNSRLYTIDVTTAVATFVGNLTTALNGTNFGFDFNPMVDRIRIVSDADQNLRVNPADGVTIVDGTLVFAAGDVNDGINPNVAGTFYTNNVAGATSTGLFNIDTNLDILVQQTPANNGTLTTIGSLGVDATRVGGADFTSVTNTTYAILVVNGVQGLYVISADGTARFVSEVNNFGVIRGIAISASATTVVTPTPTATGTPSVTPTITPTGTPSVTPTRTPSVTPTGTPSVTPTGTPSVTPTGTPSVTPTGTPSVTPTPRRVLDFDGDGRSDYANIRTNTAGNLTWLIRRSSDNGTTAVQFGLAGDVPTPGDYDGDRRADISVFRPSNGTFYVLRSSNNTFQAVQFGQNGDEPVARDYNGDGRTDYAVVRRSGNALIWFILTSDNFTFSGTQFGLATDVVAPGDYDGDGRFDLAVYRGSGTDRTGQATFFVQRSTAGFLSVQFGLGSDLVVPGDYDGDGRTDFAVVRTGSTYTWFILSSSTFTFRAVQLGAKPDLTTQADYDGDGRTDISVFRQQTATYFTQRSSDGVIVSVQFGQNGDYPVANYDTH